MAYSYPIWNDVKACIYKSSKSYGAKDTSEVNVRVGTSASNSEHLVSHYTTRREQGAYTVFTFGYQLPGQEPEVVTRKWMHTKSRAWFDAEPVELSEAAA